MSEQELLMAIKTCVFQMKKICPSGHLNTTTRQRHSPNTDQGSCAQLVWQQLIHPMFSGILS